MLLMSLQIGGGIQFRTLTPLSSLSLKGESSNLDSHPSNKKLPIIAPNYCETWRNFMDHQRVSLVLYAN
jgi:hypothetical protein